MLRRMRFVAEPPSDLRLQRFHRCAMLWLKWFVAFLDAADALAPLSKQARTIGHAWLDRIERALLAIVMLRAVRHVRRINPRKGVAEQRRKEGALARAVVGSGLRRSLRSKDLHERIARLTQNVDALVIRLLRRLPRGLTRRRPIKARRDKHVLVTQDALCSSHALPSDTS
jgi:hypothetical protein